MQRKYTMALVTAAVSAIAAQAHVSHAAVRINSNKVDEDIKSELDSLLAERAPSDLLASSAVPLFEQLSLDGKQIEIDPQLLAIQRIGNYSQQEDSTNYGNRYNGGLQNIPKSALGCYSNCHLACHSSRGWR